MLTVETVSSVTELVKRCLVLQVELGLWKLLFRPISNGTGVYLYYYNSYFATLMCIDYSMQMRVKSSLYFVKNQPKQMNGNHQCLCSHP